MSNGTVKTRFFVLLGLVGVFVLVLFYQYASIMIRPDGVRQRNTQPTGIVERGPILDRNGRVLAIQTELDTVTIWTPDVTDAEETAALLGEILDRPAEEILDRVRSARGDIVLQRAITPSQSHLIAQHRSEGRLRGVTLRPFPGRSYPERTLAANVVGYVGVENVGLDGIEYSLNNELLPVPETGRPVSGNQVFLTIDANIQAMAQAIAERGREEHSADSVIIIVADAKNGEILAYTTDPTFDPNTFSRYTADERRNAPVQKIYEPGSVFKVFSIASILQLGGIVPRDRFATSGGYVNETLGFSITDLVDRGTLDVEGVIKYSSNVGSAIAADTVSSDAFFHMLRLFGFGVQTGIMLNGEERGILARPEFWSGRTRQTIAIGQEIGTTAIQIVAAATALANRGVLLKPQIVKSIVAPDGRILQEFGREPVREVVAPWVADTMLEMMYSSTQGAGLARLVRIDGVNVSAKTGTAEVFDLAERRYSQTEFIGSVLGIFPTENPQFIVYVMVEHPRGPSIYGERTAVPILNEISEYIVQYTGMPRPGDAVAKHSGRVAVRHSDTPVLETHVPDFTGVAKRTIMPLLNREDVEIRLMGNGWVVAQDPAPGTAYRSGMVITLELE